MFKILSTNLNSLPRPVSLIPFTKTLIVEVSIFGLSRIKRWSCVVLTKNCLESNDPWKISIGFSAVPNCATPSTTLAVILDGIENRYAVLSWAPTQIKPGSKVNIEVVSSLSSIVTGKVTCALAADFERGI